VGCYDEEGERREVEKVLREECGARTVMRHWSEFRERLEEMRG